MTKVDQNDAFLCGSFQNKIYLFAGTKIGLNHLNNKIIVEFVQGCCRTLQYKGAARGVQGADQDTRWRLPIKLCTKFHFIGGKGAELLTGSLSLSPSYFPGLGINVKDYNLVMPLHTIFLLVHA